MSEEPEECEDCKKLKEKLKKYEEYGTKLRGALDRAMRWVNLFPSMTDEERKDIKFVQDSANALLGKKK